MFHVALLNGAWCSLLLCVPGVTTYVCALACGSNAQLAAHTALVVVRLVALLPLLLGLCLEPALQRQRASARASPHCFAMLFARSLAPLRGWKPLRVSGGELFRQRDIKVILEQYCSLFFCTGPPVKSYFHVCCTTKKSTLSSVIFHPAAPK